MRILVVVLAVCGVLAMGCESPESTHHFIVTFVDETESTGEPEPISKSDDATNPSTNDDDTEPDNGE